jgi:hypothetical protein
MSRKLAEGMFTQGMVKLDKLNEDVNSDEAKKAWAGARSIIGAFFVLLCDHVYGSPGETHPYGLVPSSDEEFGLPGSDQNPEGYR